MFGKKTLRMGKIADIPMKDTLPGLSALLLEAPEFVTETDSDPWWAFSEQFGQRLHTVEDDTPQLTFEAIEGDVSQVPVSSEHFDQQPTTRYKAIKTKEDATPRLVPCKFASAEEKSPFGLRRYWGVCAATVVITWGAILYFIVLLGLAAPQP